MSVLPKEFPVPMPIQTYYSDESLAEVSRMLHTPPIAPVPVSAARMEYSRDGFHVPPGAESDSSTHSSLSSPATNVVVKSMPVTWTEDDLVRNFKLYGHIMQVRVLDLGIGFVRFKTHDQALDAIDGMDQRLIEGHRLMVQFAVRKKLAVKKKSAVPSGRDNENNIYVKNLPSHFTQGKLEDLFTRFGKICSARMLKDAGFVRFIRPEDAKRAIRETTGLMIPGTAQPLEVKFAYFDISDRRSKVKPRWHPDGRRLAPIGIGGHLPRPGSFDQIQSYGRVFPRGGGPPLTPSFSTSASAEFDTRLPQTQSLLAHFQWLYYGAENRLHEFEVEMETMKSHMTAEIGLRDKRIAQLESEKKLFYLSRSPPTDMVLAGSMPLEIPGKMDYHFDRTLTRGETQPALFRVSSDGKLATQKADIDGWSQILLAPQLATASGRHVIVFRVAQRATDSSGRLAVAVTEDSGSCVERGCVFVSDGTVHVDNKVMGKTHAFGGWYKGDRIKLIADLKNGKVRIEAPDGNYTAYWKPRAARVWFVFSSAKAGNSLVIEKSGEEEVVDEGGAEDEVEEESPHSLLRIPSSGSSHVGKSDFRFGAELGGGLFFKVSSDGKMLTKSGGEEWAGIRLEPALAATVAVLRLRVDERRIGGGFAVAVRAHSGTALVGYCKFCSSGDLEIDGKLVANSLCFGGWHKGDRIKITAHLDKGTVRIEAPNGAFVADWRPRGSCRVYFAVNAHTTGSSVSIL